MTLELLYTLIAGGTLASGAGAYFIWKSFQHKELPPSTSEKDQAQQELSPTEQSTEAVPTPQAQQPTTPAKDRKEYRSLQDALSKTKAGLWGKLSKRWSPQDTLGKSDLDDLEEALYTSDLGPKTVDHLLSQVSARMNGQGMNLEGLNHSLREEMTQIFAALPSPEFKRNPEGLTVWMIVGVNGAGKTTTIGKIACQEALKGKKVLVAAGDTFRAAADAQLKVWAERAQVEIFSPEGIKDPSAIAFDAIQKAQAKNFDLVIIDTAGRLHTQKNLMEELKKMKRVMNKALEGTPHETILVLDGNSGQNALIQAEQFHSALDVSGVILTKMDGSAKGGVAVGIACEHQLPVKMVGVGEALEDLRPFNSSEFIDSIL